VKEELEKLKGILNSIDNMCDDNFNGSGIISDLAKEAISIVDVLAEKGKDETLEEYVSEAIKAFESLTPDMLPKDMSTMPSIYSQEDIDKLESSK
jgi:hypothetical protein